MKEVEAGTTGRQKYGVACLGQVVAGLNAILHIVCITHGNAETVEVFVQFRVVGTQENQSLALLFDKLVDVAVVVTLVFSAEDKDGRRAHAFQRVPASIHVCGL